MAMMTIYHPSAFPDSGDINFDLSKATELYCRDIFNCCRACRLNSLGFR